MKTSAGFRPWAKRLLVMVLVLLPSATLSTAQQNPPVVPPGMSGLGQTWQPDQGDWLEVLTVTDKWLVLQNEQGQQFPVSFDAVDLFVIRWPIALGQLGVNDLVETTGIDLGTQVIAADHVDVYRGNARNLVTPTIQRIMGMNRVVTLFDAERQNVLGLTYQYTLTPQEWFMPWRYHVVANPINIDPLTVSVGGNNGMTITGGSSGFGLTEITRGVPSFVRAGDVAYAVPLLNRTTPRSMVLSQLVIYKDISVDAFAR